MIGYGVEGSRKVRIFSMSRILPYTGELDLKLGGVTDLVSPFQFYQGQNVRANVREACIKPVIRILK